MLTILTAGPGCGKTTALLRRMSALAEKGIGGVLLVPESASHQAERRLLEACGNRAGEYLTVTTFSKLTEDVLARTGGAPLTLDAGGRVLTMHQALSQVRSSLTYYKRAERPQLVARLLETAEELKVCAISPETMLGAERLSPKIRDLALIYAQYCALCASGAPDPADRTEIAAARLADSGLLRGAELLVDDFDGFTAQKYRLLEKMLRQAVNTTVALPLGQDEELYTEQRETLFRLRRLAEGCGIPVQVQALEPAPRPRAAGLKGLAEALFDFSAQPVEAAEGLALYSLRDPGAECELAAALARQWALEGVRLREMAVVCGDLDSYGEGLQTAFARYDIPLFLSTKDDLLEKPALAAATGGLAALEDGLSGDSVLRWLKTGLLGVPQEERDLLENYLYTWQIRGEGWNQPFTLSTSGYQPPFPDEAQRLERVNAVRQQVALLLGSLREAFSVCRTGGDFARAMQAHLSRIQLEQQLESRCDTLRRTGREREAAEEAQLYQILSDSLEQFSGVMNQLTMDRREFLQLWRLMLSQYDVSAIPPSLDSVLAVSFERMSAGSIRRMVIVGGREGVFPPVKHGGSLLTEPERVALEGAGIELTQSALDRAYQQQCCVCRAAAAPAEQLAVTVSRRLTGGEECRPSYLFTRLSQLRACPVQDGDGVLQRLRLTAPKPLFSVACAAAESGGEGLSRAALRYARQDAANRAYFSRLRDYARAPRGPVGDPALVRQLYGGKLNMTASRIERISSCRFSYFMQYGLRAQPRREARFGAPEIGTFVHAVVEQSVRDLSQNAALRLEAVVARHVNHYLEEQLPADAQSARFLAIFRQAGRLVTDIVRNVWDEVEAGKFHPMCFELDFSPRGDLPPLSVQAGGVTLTVGGKIDRVDGYIRGDRLYLKVVDYKTGSKSFHLSDVLYGLNLQMLLYLLMLEQGDRGRLLKLAGVDPQHEIQACAALYIPAKSPFAAARAGEAPEEIRKRLEKELRRIGLVRDDADLLDAMERGGQYRFLPVGLKKDGSFTAASAVVTAAQLGRLLRKTEDTLRGIACQIAGGDVEATPYRTGRDFTVCQWCDYLPACHFDCTMKKDKLRFLPVLPPAQVHAMLEQEEEEPDGTKTDR